MSAVPSAPITITQAREQVLGSVRRLGEERVAVGEALDRVLARDVLADGDVPPFACSAMDGYAIKAGDAGRVLRVIGESRAGAPANRPVDDGQAIRISTGGAVPDGAEAVIRQEDVDERDHSVRTEMAIDPGTNIRYAGEDMRDGTVVLPAGTVLGAAALGAAVAAGAGDVIVAQRPRVATLCTGDELRAPGEPLGPGEIHNSNAPMLVSLATRSGALATPGNRLPDDPAATTAALAAALETSDVVVVSGGVSVGPHDHVKPALQALGVSEVFWRVALQPGGPTWFGERDGRLVFGLPGNPVSAFVTFALFVRPALAALQGAVPEPLPVREAVLAQAVPRNRTREQAIRVRLERRNGTTVAIPNGPQGSHVMSSLLGADALAFIPHGDGELPAGAQVALEFLPR
jgi:molybdopterin molybdotransferase